MDDDDVTRLCTYDLTLLLALVHDRYPCLLILVANLLSSALSLKYPLVLCSRRAQDDVLACDMPLSLMVCSSVTSLDASVIHNKDEDLILAATALEKQNLKRGRRLSESEMGGAK